MIGDDFQSIYGRRGALMENFLNVKKYRPDIQMFKLQINYRSRPHIVAAGNHIIKNNINQYKKEIVAHRTGDDKITIFAHYSLLFLTHLNFLKYSSLDCQCCYLLHKCKRISFLEVLHMVVLLQFSSLENLLSLRLYQL